MDGSLGQHVLWFNVDFEINVPSKADEGRLYQGKFSHSRQCVSHDAGYPVSHLPQAAQKRAPVKPSPKQM